MTDQTTSRSNATRNRLPLLPLLGAALVMSAAPFGCSPASDAADTQELTAASEPVVIYSGRSEDLVGPLFERYEQETGRELEVRYGKTTELAATILEEGPRTPAALFFSQETGALGALAAEGRLAELPQSVLDRVPAAFRSDDGLWVGVSGRARTVVFNTAAVDNDQLPDSVLELTDPRYRGRVGWAPTNASFQAFVTAMRIELGEERTKQWLLDMMANDPQQYPKNSAIVRAVGAGEVDLGLVNHYYLHRFLAEEGEEFPARNHYTTAGDAGSLVMVAGVGLLDRAAEDDARREAAIEVLEYLLSADAQQFLVEHSYEYPLVAGVPVPDGLRPLDEIRPPQIDLSRLSDLEGTLALLRTVELLP